MIKVYGGTPQHGGNSLCRRCRDAQIVTERHTGRMRQYCQSRGEVKEIPWNVSDCTEFDDKAKPALWQMEKIAWRFRVDDKRRTAGFLTPREFAEKHPDED